MSEPLNHVWYASYGSNLLRARFMCYIEGGTPPGATTRNPGCRLKRAYAAERPIQIPHRLYFAGHTRSWGGAPAFITRQPGTPPTLGRMYLITEEQFNDVVCQENGLPVNGTTIVPALGQLRSGDVHRLPFDRLYSLLICIGEADGAPILTFTSARDLQIAAPSQAYLRVIVAGLRETWPALSNAELRQYLSQADGIADRADLLDFLA